MSQPIRSNLGWRKVLFFIALLPGILLSQSSDAQEAVTSPRFQSQTNLVLMPVLIRNHGKHVPNLKQESFTLLQDGKPQQISVFEEVRTSSERLQRAAVGPKEFTNRVIGSTNAARYTVIAIDNVNTSSMDLIRVRQGLAKFLAHTFDNGEPISLIAITANGIRVLQDFTTDQKAIDAALNRGTSSNNKPVQSSVGMDEFRQEVATSQDGGVQGLEQLLEAIDHVKDNENRAQTFQERSTRLSSLDALQQIALWLTGVPGRKSLVWASSGFPFLSLVKQAKGSVAIDYSQVNEAMALDAYTTHLLSAANIAMYPVDARGLTNTSWDSIDPSHKYSPTMGEKMGRDLANRDVLATFDSLASGTGGKACYNRPDLADCFKEALDDSRDYYMIGFYVDKKHTKEGWHKLQVKVEEKGGTVRSMSGFLFPLPDPAKTREQDMTTAVHSLLVDSGIPFRGEWTTTEKKGDKVAEGFVIQMGPEANVIDTAERTLNLEFVGVARAKDGTIAGQFARKVQRTLSPEDVALIQQSGVSYRFAIDLAPGEYLVRLVVRDNHSGRTGAANTPLTVQ